MSNQRNNISVKLSDFIIRLLDCQEPELESEKWQDIRPEPDTSGTYLIVTTVLRLLVS